MTGPVYILARSCAEPDQEFPTLTALARAVVAIRDAAPPDAEGLPAELALTEARVSRGGLPGGLAVSIRMRDGCSPRGALLGYALMPEHTGPGFAPCPAGQLMDAILAVTRQHDRRAA